MQDACILPAWAASATLAHSIFKPHLSPTLLDLTPPAACQRNRGSQKQNVEAHDTMSHLGTHRTTQQFEDDIKFPKSISLSPREAIVKAQEINKEAGHGEKIPHLYYL